MASLSAKDPCPVLHELGARRRRHPAPADQEGGIEGYSILETAAGRTSDGSPCTFIPEVTPSCLLLMGITDLAEGSVWNTMPPHLHERRMEAYCYFDMAAEDRIIHLMGRPEETRHLIGANGDAVLSPAWSIHMGAGTGPYAFVWGMTGENQEYNDVAPVALAELK